jgi:hypothetical protein
MFAVGGSIFIGFIGFIGFIIPRDLGKAKTEKQFKIINRIKTLIQNSKFPIQNFLTLPIPDSWSCHLSRLSRLSSASRP